MNTKTPNTPTTSASPTDTPLSPPQNELHIFKLRTDAPQGVQAWLNPKYLVTSRITLSLPQSDAMKAESLANSERTLQALTDMCPEALKFFDEYMSELRLKTGMEWDLVWMKIYKLQFMVELGKFV